MQQVPGKPVWPKIEHHLPNEDAIRVLFTSEIPLAVFPSKTLANYTKKNTKLVFFYPIFIQNMH